MHTQLAYSRVRINTILKDVIFDSIYIAVTSSIEKIVSSLVVGN